MAINGVLVVCYNKVFYCTEKDLGTEGFRKSKNTWWNGRDWDRCTSQSVCHLKSVVNGVVKLPRVEKSRFFFIVLRTNSVNNVSNTLFFQIAWSCVNTLTCFNLTISCNDVHWFWLNFAASCMKNCCCNTPTVSQLWISWVNDCISLLVSDVSHYNFNLQYRIQVSTVSLILMYMKTRRRF